MADTVQDDLEIKPADAGTMFRAEMLATQVLLGYWKAGVAVVVVVLVAILAWGQYSDWYRRGQRSTTAQVASQVDALPAPLHVLGQQVAAGETVDLAAVEVVGDQLVAVADEGTGTSAIEGRIMAAEAFRIAGKPDKQRAALENAVGGEGVLGFAVESGLANLDLEQGKGDAAVDRLKALAAREKGFLAEQASVDLGLALEHLDRKEEAAKVYADFVARFPESPRLDDVKARQQRVAP